MKTSIVISTCGQLRDWSNAKGPAFPIDDVKQELIVDSSGGILSGHAKKIYLPCRDFSLIVSLSKTHCLTCLSIHNCVVELSGECSSLALFNSIGSLKSITKIVFSNTKFRTPDSQGMLDPWKQLGRALARLPKLETLHLLFVSMDCAISLFNDRNFSRNGSPLKEFSYNDRYHLMGCHEFEHSLHQKFRKMVTACQKCIHLETMRIGEFLDGDRQYPIIGRKLGYDIVNPVSRTCYYKGIIERPFAEVPLVARACSTLKRLDIQFCSRAALWRLFTCVIEKNALEVLIVRSDDRRLESGYLEGVKTQQLLCVLLCFCFY